MEYIHNTFLIFLLISTLHQVPASLALGNKVLHIPEKIIGGVIDIVQSHKNKPSTQATFQQTVQTQTTFNQQGNPQGTAANGQQWTPSGNQGAGFQGQAQFQAQGQYGYGQGGNYQGTGPAYPANTAAPTAPYPVNPATYVPQQSSQSQSQGQYQNFHNQGQFQSQNQQGNFQSQNQNQAQTQVNPGQYGTGSYQGSGQFVQTGNNNQNVGQSGNYQGSVAQTSNGNYQSTGQINGGGYQNVGQSSGNYQGQTGNYQSQGGQYQGSSAQYGQTQLGQFGQTSQASQGGQIVSQVSQSSGGSQSAFVSQSGGFQQSVGNGCVCQSWTKPSETPVLHDEAPKIDGTDKKPELAKPIQRAVMMNAW